MVKDCSNCKFAKVVEEYVPCRSCYDYDAWKPECEDKKDDGRTCTGCKHMGLESDVYPCVECKRIYKDLWEPKESTPRKQMFTALDKLVDAIEDLREQLEAEDED